MTDVRVIYATRLAEIATGATSAAWGRTGVWAKAGIPMRAQNRQKRASVEVIAEHREAAKRP